MLKKLVVVLAVVFVVVASGCGVSRDPIDRVPEQLFWEFSLYGGDFFVAKVVRFSDEIAGTGLKMALVCQSSEEADSMNARYFGAPVPVNSPIRIGDDVEVFNSCIFNHDRGGPQFGRFIRPRGDGSAPKLPPPPK